MCLIIFAYNEHPKYKFILASNRDEFSDRSALPVHFWKDYPDVLAGKDIKHQGTWLGVTKGGRFSAVTNYRDGEPLSKLHSRGVLTKDFLTGKKEPFTYLFDINEQTGEYDPFNLLVGDRHKLFFFSNKQREIEEVPSGVHALSNSFLDVPWPKVTKGKQLFEDTINNDLFKPKDLFGMLADKKEPDDIDLPDTGVGLDWERLLSPIFIQSEKFRTVSSTIMTWDYDDNIYFAERVYRKNPAKYEEKEFRFRVC